MKSIRFVLATAVLFATAAFAQTSGQKSFDVMKSLAGQWEGKDSRGQALQVSYRITGDGSALMSEIQSHHGDMISMFHMDNDRFLMTHYCDAGNQPRMAGTLSPDGSRVKFDFVDGTNLQGSKRGHMNELVVSVTDADHHTEDWTFVQDGKEMREHFDLHRIPATQAKM